MRLECSATLNAADTIGIAWLSQVTLYRYATGEY